MKICLKILIILCISTHAFSAPTKYSEYNFIIEVPSNWDPVSPLPQTAIAAFQNPDRLKILILNAVKPPTEKKDKFLLDTIAGLKDGMAEIGLKVSSDQMVTYGSLQFKVISGHTSSGNSMASYITSAGDFVYCFQLINKAGNAHNDPELKSIIGSFDLLIPVKN